MSPESGPVGQSVVSSERRYIIYPDGKRFGPFESLELALKVREYVEAVEQRNDLAIKREDGRF